MMTQSSSDDLPTLIVTKPGFYRHYKGGEYEVIGTVRHSEDLQPMTLYRALNTGCGCALPPCLTKQWSLTVFCSLDLLF
jgi:hypothetical protein